MHFKTLALALTAASTCMVANVQADYVYPLQIERANNRSINALVTKINDSQFITDAELVKGADNLFIIDNSVTPAAKIVATVVFADAKQRIAILSASNVTGKAVTLAAQDQPVGGQLLLQTDKGSVPTLVQRFAPAKDLAPGDIYVHTALYNNQQWAAPLLNNCQQLLGLSVFESSLFTRMQQPEVIAYASSSSLIKSVLTAQKITFSVSADRCLSDVEQAKANAEKAAKEAADSKAAQEAADAAAKAKLEEAQKQAEEAKKQADKLLQDAKDAADKLAKQHDEQVKQVEEALKKAEEERQKAEDDRVKAKELADKEAEEKRAAEQQKLYLMAGGAAVIAFLLVIFMLAMRKRKLAIQAKEAELQQQKQHASGLAQNNEQLAGQVAQMQQSFNDILLDGTTRDGRKIRVKVNGKALAQSKEQVIGRESSQVDYPIAEAEISRRHVRLLLQGNQLLVEDLQSQNGSWLNNVQLVAGQPIPLASGSILRLSSIEFQVTYL